MLGHATGGSSSKAALRAGSWQRAAASV